MDEFQASQDTQMSFPPSLTSQERAAVHAECLKRGLRSRSYGGKASRQVHVFKARQQSSTKSEMLPLSEKAMHLLVTHLQRHPPVQQELEAAAQGGADDSLYAAAPAKDEKKNMSKRKERVENGSAEQDGQKLASEMHQRVEENPESRSLGQQRQKLPIHAFQQEIMQAINKNQVVLVAGETGCGKTTQVPQYIVDHCWADGRPCNIMCTQPRRISAVTVAERVAKERAERIGGGIGYQIRLETRVGPKTYMTFCTNGVLLRKLTLSNAAASLEEFTHIIIDEIHERDRFADFLLIILKDLLPMAPHLRVVLMSATLNSEAFMSYFSCPMVKVPGFTYPVEDFYLEDILALCEYSEDGQPTHSIKGRAHTPKEKLVGETLHLDRKKLCRIQGMIKDAFLTGDDHSFNLLWSSLMEDPVDGLEGQHSYVNVQHDPTGTTALMAAAGKGRLDLVTALMNCGADIHLRSSDGSTAKDWALRFGFQETASVLQSMEEQARSIENVSLSTVRLSQYQLRVDPDEVDLELVCEVVMYICRETPLKGKDADGAILVFLPGWDEILRLNDLLSSFNDRSPFKLSVLPLHSMVSPDEQRKAFKRPPKGVRKVVLSTNIAETSITIDDIVYVVNSGRLKEKSYDPFTGVSTLQSQWHSRASEKQRRGRAGRCRPGQCYNLYSKSRNESFSEFALPELKRSPLDELALQVKLLQQGALARSITISRGIGGIEGFLQMAIEPPVSQAVTAAVQLLIDIGALTSNEELTFLGRHLANLPLPPQVGKMLLFAVLFQCLDPVLTLACGTAYRDPFVVPADPQERQKAANNRKYLGNIGGGLSDHLLLVAAYEGWVAARKHGQEHRYCRTHYLSPGTMQVIDGMRRQLLSELKSTGMVADLVDASINAHNREIVRNVISAGMYPMYGSVLPKVKDAKDPRITILTRRGDKVSLHQSSINQGIKIKESEQLTLVTYDEMIRGDSRLYIRSSTLASLHFLCFVAASLCILKEEEDQEEGMEPEEADNKDQSASDYVVLLLDNWIACKVPVAAVGPLSLLRIRVLASFAYKVKHPRSRLPEVLHDSLSTVANLFCMETLPQIHMEKQENPTFRPSEILPRRDGHHSGRSGSSYPRSQHRGGHVSRSTAQSNKKQVPVPSKANRSGSRNESALMQKNCQGSSTSPAAEVKTVRHQPRHSRGNKHNKPRHKEVESNKNV
uniref:RNA helicase n=1 Tax=Picocystis salinarum TaxID=88271 RepID=A0A7S3XH27_9CHLO